MITSIDDLVIFLQSYHRHWLESAQWCSQSPVVVPPDLPKGLATIYRELGTLAEIKEYPSPFNAQDALVPFSRLKRINDMVEFAWENQGNWSARCLVNQSDPNVYSNAADVWEEEARGFVVVCESLNHFLITLCLQEAVMSSRYLAALRTDLPPCKVLNIPAEPLWLNGYYVLGEPDHDFYWAKDSDVLMMDYGGLWLASPTCEVRSFAAKGVELQDITLRE